MRPSGPVAAASPERADGMLATAVLQLGTGRAVLPNTVPPSWNLTDPVGKSAPGLVTLMLAARVTLWPNIVPFAAEVMAVVVAAWLTVCSQRPDVLPL